MPQSLLFGLNIDPTTSEYTDQLARAQLADRLRLDAVTVQDHPYQRRFLDTMTLVTALAMRTERVHVGTNVANLPLRPPAMLAKQAASLDVISGGRVILGLGAGAFWQGIKAWGGDERTPGQAFAGFRDALHILRGLWDSDGRGFTYQGSIYSVEGAQFGPLPNRRIPIWVGGYGPKMLHLTGMLADGLIVSTTYTPPSQLPEFNRRIDEGAAEAGRSPGDIRRAYNVMGIIDAGQYGRRPAGLQDGIDYGTPRDWIDRLTGYNREQRQDTFLFWPVGDDPLRQIEAFAQEVVPGVRAAAGTA